MKDNSVAILALNNSDRFEDKLKNLSRNDGKFQKQYKLSEILEDWYKTHLYKFYSYTFKE